MTGRIARAERISIRDSAALQRLLERKGLIAQTVVPEPPVPQPTLPDFITDPPKFRI